MVNTPRGISAVYTRSGIRRALARFARSLVLVMACLAVAGCATRYVRADVPDAIYDCKPKTRPKFEPGTPERPFALNRKEAQRFKAFVLENESCLKAWRSWAR